MLTELANMRNLVTDQLGEKWELKVNKLQEAQQALENKDIALQAQLEQQKKKIVAAEKIALQQTIAHQRQLEQQNDQLQNKLTELQGGLVANLQGQEQNRMLTELANMRNPVHRITDNLGKIWDDDRTFATSRPKGENGGLNKVFEQQSSDGDMADDMAESAGGTGRGRKRRKMEREGEGEGELLGLGLG